MGLRVLAEHADRGDQVRGVTDEPGRPVAVGGARLARHLLAGACRVVPHRGARGAVVDHAGEDRGDGVGGVAGQDPLADGVGHLHRGAALLGLLDQGRGDLQAVAGERRVGPGHLQRARAHGAQRVRGQRLELLGLHAHPAGGLQHLFHADVHAHLGEHGVDRLVHRGLHGDVAVVHVVLVRRREGDVAADDGPLAGAVVDRVRGDLPRVLGGRAPLQRRREDHRLEGRRGLVVGAGGVAEVVLQVVLAAVEGHDPSGLRVHGDRAGLDGSVDLALLGVQLAGELPLDGLLQRLLLLRVDVERDVPALALDLGLGLRGGDALGLHQLPLEFLVGQLHQVAGLALEAGRGARLLGHRELHARAVGGAEPLHLDHVVERVVPALLGQPLARPGSDRPVVLVGRLQQRGQVGALPDREVLGVDAVVGLGGGLDAVGAAAVVAGVQVTGEDLVLGHLPVHLQRDDDLPHLAGDGLVLREVVVLHVLLGDRRAALLALALRGVQQAAEGALDVDAGVLVEGLVLGGDEGVLDRLGHHVDVDDVPVDLAALGEDLAVAVAVDVALALRQGVALVRDVHQQVQGYQGADAEQADAEERAEQLPPGEEPAYAPWSARTS